MLLEDSVPFSELSAFVELESPQAISMDMETAPSKPNQILDIENSFNLFH